MRILVLNQHYWPEIAATAQLLEDLCEDLVVAGHEVTVVCGQPSNRRAEGEATRTPARETHRGVCIRRVWTYASRGTVPERAAHYATYFAGSLAESLLAERHDVALVMSTPPLVLGLSGAVLRLLRRTPYVYSVQDLFPDALINLGFFRPGPLTTTIERVAGGLFRGAREVVAISSGMASALLGKGVRRERLSVVPNWADTDAVTPLPRDNAFAREHGLADRFTVLYSGNIGMSQGIEHLPAAAAEVADLPVTFAVVGSGVRLTGLRAEVARRGLARVRFFPPQPRDRLAEVLSSGDVGLVPMRRGMENDQVPSKLYGVLAAGRPVLAPVHARSEVAAVIDRFGCGRVVPPEDPKALGAEVRALFEAPGGLAAMGAAGRAACVAHYSRRVCTARYEAILRRAVPE